MSASGRSWRGRRPWRRADRPAAAGHQLAGRRRRRVRPDPVQDRLRRPPRRSAPGQDQPELAARPQPRRPAHHPGHLPAARLPPLPRPGTLHPLPGQRPARDLPPPPPAGGPAADPGRAGHRRLAPTLCLRCGVESLISQASRLSDLHQARYRGLAKTHLQHVLTALALNLVRVDAWLTGAATTGSWTSRLARLTQPLQQPEFARESNPGGRSAGPTRGSPPTGPRRRRDGGGGHPARGVGHRLPLSREVIRARLVTVIDGIKGGYGTTVRSPSGKLREGGSSPKPLEGRDTPTASLDDEEKRL